MPVLSESSSLGSARRVYAVERDPITIGRSADNAIVVRDCTASKRHASIVLEDGRRMLRDLGSRNGTYVNGERVGERALAEGDEVRIGATRFRLLASAPDGEAGPVALSSGGESSRRYAEADGSSPSGEGAIDRLWAFARTMHLARDPIDFASILVNAVIDLLGADRGTIVVLEEQGGPPALRIDGERDAEAALEPPDTRAGAFRRAIESGTTVPVEAGAPLAPDGPPRHALAVPIAPHRSLLAVAYVERHAHRAPFSRRDVRAAELLSALAGHGLLATLR